MTLSRKRHMQTKEKHQNSGKYQNSFIPELKAEEELENVSW